MRHVSVLLFLAVGVVGATACEAPIVLVRPEGQPTYISPQSSMTAELESMFGASPAPGAILVIDSSARTGAWLSPDSTLSVAEVALLYGAETGAGFEYIGPDHCAPPDLPLDLDLRSGPERQPGDLIGLDDPARPVEDLFPDESPLALQPRSGLWQARLGKTQLRGCPAMMRQAFPHSPGALPAEWLTPRPLQFSRPFHPDQLALSRTLAGEGLGSVSWRALADNSWQAEVMPQIFAQIPTDQGSGSSMIWMLSVEGPDRIDHVVEVKLVFPAEAAAVMGGDGCSMISFNQWIRVGD